jgi:LPS export ABC transporter protein LptC
MLYFIYVNRNTITNKVQLEENVADEQKLSAKEDDPTEYEAKILNSTFKGVNDKLNHYQIKTHYATKALADDYTLEDISAIYEINKEQLLVVTAKNAIMNRENQMLKLSNNVVFTLGDATLKAQDIKFNLLNKETFSETGVILDYKHSKISAKDFSATNDNNILNFKNKVSTIIDVSDF